MQVEEYIREALLSIVRGVAAAQSDPLSRDMIGRLPVAIPQGVAAQMDFDQNVVTMVEFDLATTVDRSGGGKAGISVLGTELGGDGRISSTAANRIKFSVPVGMPGPETQKCANESARLAAEAQNRRAIEEFANGPSSYAV